MSAVCERTGIDRATFYRHFDTMDDLVTDALAAYANEGTSQWERTSTGSGEQYEESSRIFSRYLAHIEDNWALYRWALGPTGSIKTIHALLQQLAQSTAAELAKLHPDLPAPERELRSAYIAGGIMGAYVHWLSSDVPQMSSRKLTEQLLRLSQQYDLATTPV